MSDKYITSMYVTTGKLVYISTVLTLASCKVYAASCIKGQGDALSHAALHRVAWTYALLR